jgi:O-antigen ligase
MLDTIRDPKPLGATPSQDREGTRTKRASVPQRLVRGFTALILLAFPALILLVRHGGSAPYHLLAVVGIMVIACRFPAAARAPYPEEKLAIVGFGIFALTIIVSLLDTGMSREAVRELDVLLRPLWAIPIVYLLIRVHPSAGMLWLGASVGAVLAGSNAIWEVAIADHYVRVGGATSPVTYGNTALAMGVIAAAGIPYFRRLGTAYLVIPASALLLGALASFLSGSRGGWIALPALAFLLMWGCWRSSYRRCAAAGALALAAVASFAVMVPQTGVKSRIDRAVLEVKMYLQDPMAHGDTSIGQRFELWRAAWDMFKEKPLLGGGIGHSFNKYVREGIAAGEYHPAIAVQTMPHNVVLDVLALRGLIGLAGLLVLWLGLTHVFLGAARETDMRIRALGTAGLVLIVSYALFGLTDSVMDYGPPLVFFCLYAVLIVHLIARARAAVTQPGGA